MKKANAIYFFTFKGRNVNYIYFFNLYISVSYHGRQTPNLSHPPDTHTAPPAPPSNAERGQVYDLWLDVAHLAPRPIGLHQPIHTTVTDRSTHAFLTSTAR